MIRVIVTGMITRPALAGQSQPDPSSSLARLCQVMMFRPEWPGWHCTGGTANTSTRHVRVALNSLSRRQWTESDSESASNSPGPAFHPSGPGPGSWHALTPTAQSGSASEQGPAGARDQTRGQVCRGSLSHSLAGHWISDRV